MTASLSVRDLRVDLDDSGHDVVAGIAFDIAPGEILGLVGESGSGKTTVGTALLGYARRGARIVGGSVRVDERDVLAASPSELRDLRGRVVAYVPQDPASALNPALRVGTQMREVLEAHGHGADRARLLEALAEVKLPPSEEILRRFPHQLSGGQQQRICIAMAFLLRPRIVVLDEPTTGLDVSTQAHVLETVRSLCRQHEAAALYVTHDLSVVANLADRVMVMYAGRMAEIGAREAIFANPAHPYTARLLRAIPDVRERRRLEPLAGQAPPPGGRPHGCEFAPRCPAAIAVCREQAPPVVELAPGHSARCHRAAEHAVSPSAPAAPRVEIPGGRPVLAVEDVSAGYGSIEILHGVSFELQPRECVALVGESGSGKTTLARCAIGLHEQWSGRIAFGDEQLARAARGRTVDARRRLQYVFQSPYNSLNPRKTVREIVATPLRHFFGARGQEADARVAAALEQVALAQRMLDRYPDQLSGGERQRVAIARALVCEPEVLICDEITSALDVSVQAAIVEVLRDLQREHHLGLLFVTHDLALVRTIADRVIVLDQGRVVEANRTDELLDAPTQPYTRQLLQDTPALSTPAAGAMS